ncbi:VWA domain-containing protein [Gemmiger sp. An194]|uniref:VWA domain-containing protein n=1 Tax=Gemmiger sp. An194 TaxID=1965582 RepID=UPI000B36D144|nr:VWA domain-containing protein [Gemmiger sp. An194]OUP25177.1 hypothetical protein B5F28_02530 [Gemmiger sp. An194]
MKHKMWSRLLSMALAVMMIASIVPNSAFAEAGSELAASSQVVTEMVEGTEEVTQAEETTGEEPAEQPAGETASDEEPVAEPSTEPAVESEQPTTEPTQAPAETAVSSEQPSAEPSAAPEATETPNASAQPSETPAASATPAPSESPVPSETPAPSEEPAIDGQALLDELMAIEDDEAFLKAVSELTEEQTAALEALGEEALAEYTLRVESLTAAQQQEEKFTELYEKLMAAESIQEIEELLNDYSDEELNSFVDFLGEARYTELTGYITAKAAEDQEAPVSKVFTDAGPLMPAVSVGRRSLRAAANFLNADGGNAGEDALKISKTLEGWNKDTGTGTLVLEAYSIGEYKTEIIEKAVPVDIVLVLDQSGSMGDSFQGASNRQAAMKEAVNNFITKVSEKYGEESDHRMAIVEFGSSSNVLANWTEMDVQGAESLHGVINSLPNRPSGATNIGSGMQNAENLLIGDSYKYTGENSKRHKVAIVFTDGVPTTSNDFDTGVANAAIQSAYNMKNAGVTVYSIGIFTGVNSEQLFGSSGFDTNSDGSIGSKWIKDTWGFFPGTDFPEADIPAANRFLNYLSNNYKTATNVGLYRDTEGWGIFHYKVVYEITENFERDSDKYYLTADDQTSLNQIFETIKDEIGSGSTSVTLDEESVVRDVMSPYFTVNGTKDDVQVYAVPSTGKDPESGEFQFNDDAGTWILLPDAAEVTGKVVDVSGFDFSNRYVAEEPRENPQNPSDKGYYGEKLRIEIPIKVDYSKTFGGNQIPTNDESRSGVYMTKDTAVPEKTFTSPKADVAINYDFITKDSSIYVGNEQNLKDLFQHNATHNGSAVPVDGDTNKYVTIRYEVFKGNDLLGTYTIKPGQQTGNWTDAAKDIPFDCTQYTIKCEVTPKDLGTVESWNQEKGSKVHVFVPTITWKDGTIGYNDTLSEKFLKSRAVTVQWNDASADAGEKPSGFEPILEYTFNDKSGNPLVNTNITSDVDVCVKVSYESGLDITEYTSFGWQKDNDEGNVCGDSCTKPDGFQFRIHVGTGDLTISKILTSFNASKGEKVTFLFEVKNEATGKVYYQSISFDSTELNVEKSKTIKGLPAGKYVVTELVTNGYEATGGKTSVSNLEVGRGKDAKAIFENYSNGDKVPGDNEYVNNQFTYTKDTGWTWTKAAE